MRASLLSSLLVLVTACGDGAGGAGPSTAAPTTTGAGGATATGTSTSTATATGGAGGAPTTGTSTSTSTGAGGTGGAAPPPNRPPTIADPGARHVAEDTTITVAIDVSDPDGDPVRVFALDLPPGARFDEPTRTLTFTPDFTQGGGRDDRVVQLVARDPHGLTATRPLAITIDDTIHPPDPVIVEHVPGDGAEALVLSIPGDPYLDPAGKATKARVVVPAAANAGAKEPVRVYLHGFGGSPYAGTPVAGQFRVYPHDPDDTYWWGRRDPGGATVPPYTARRVLHLLAWVLATQPGADPERVYVTGGSMGGAGALTIGLLWARHFAFAEGQLAQLVPRNHRPARIAQLEGVWGPVATNLPDGTALEDGRAVGVWDRMDLTRVVDEVPEARDQHVALKHGKDDPTIHFGAVVFPSPLTKRSGYQALAEGRIGHYAVWDEGGHGEPDPVLGAGWWDDDWSRVFDPTAYLARDRPFPAFGASSADDDPGDGSGNGKQPFSASAGYAGTIAVAGDTGWSGAIAGAKNRFLRWDANATVDTVDRLELALVLASGDGSAAPKAGYPTKGDQRPAAGPIVTDVTPRRARAFRCLPGEVVRFTYGATTGTVTADARGEVTVPKIAVGDAPTTLVIERTW